MAAVPNQTAPMSRMQAMALRLATMPMLAGVGSLLLWLQFEVTALLVMGYGALALGILCALFVPFLLLRSWPEAPNARNTILISVLAISNVPVAFTCLLQGVHRMTRLHVVIQNDADSAWLAVQLVGGGIVGEATIVPAKARESRDVWASQDGRLELHYIQEDQPRRVLLAGYVTKNLGGTFTVVRDAAGAVTVQAQ